VECQCSRPPLGRKTPPVSPPTPGDDGRRPVRPASQSTSTRRLRCREPARSDCQGWPARSKSPAPKCRQGEGIGRSVDELATCVGSGDSNGSLLSRRYPRGTTRVNVVFVGRGFRNSRCTPAISDRDEFLEAGLYPNIARRKQVISWSKLAFDAVLKQNEIHDPAGDRSQCRSAAYRASSDLSVQLAQPPGMRRET
jgi:hypothetical protein